MTIRWLPRLDKSRWFFVLFFCSMSQQGSWLGVLGEGLLTSTPQGSGTDSKKKASSLKVPGPFSGVLPRLALSLAIAGSLVPISSAQQTCATDGAIQES